MAFLLLKSNRLETFLEEVCARLGKTRQDPMAAWVVAVPNRMVAEWLRQRLAERFGVVANVSFPFPREVVERYLESSTGIEFSETWNETSVTVAIACALLDLKDQPGFEFVSASQSTGDSEVATGGLVALSRQIARVFDRYITYRPEMVLDWSRKDLGPNDDWQPRLFRELRKRLGPSLADAWSKLEGVGGVRALDAAREVAPTGTLLLFGIPWLPRVYLDVLRTMGQSCDVVLMALAPSKHFLGDLEEADHPLLAMCAPYLADFQTRLENLGAQQPFEDTLFQEPAGDTLLAQVQRDVVLAQTGAHGSPPESDGTIQVHSCYSPLGQVEALKDYLLNLFDRHRDLEPQDVLVVTPDLERFGPLLASVLTEPWQGESTRIPTNLQARPPGPGEGVANLLHALLEAAGGRATLVSLTALLENPFVTSTSGITESEVSRLLELARDCGVRWGIDADDREQAGFPGWYPLTMRFGADRMLLRLAMDEGEFSQMAPSGHLDEDDARLVGIFAEMVDRLAQCVRDLRGGPRTLREWVDAASRCVARFSRGRPSMLPECLKGLVAACSVLNPPFKMDLLAFQRMLPPPVESNVGAVSTSGNAVTIGEFGKVRGLPAKVVCLVGLDESAFPAQPDEYFFDLTAGQGHRQSGDRDQRAEQLWEFLELLCAAKKGIAVFYQGKDPVDGSPLPPSQATASLLEHLSLYVDPASVVVEHGRYAFSPKRIPERLGSPGTYFARAVEGILATGETTSVCEPPRQGPGPSWPGPRRLRSETIALKDLARFLEDPARYYVTTLWGAEPRPPDTDLPTEDPLILSPLERYQASIMALEWLDRSPPEVRGPGDLHRKLLARGLAVPGPCGLKAAEEVFASALELHQAAQEARGGLPPKDRFYKLSTRYGVVAGTVSGISGARLVMVWRSRQSFKGLVRLWVNHLLLSASGPDGYEEAILVYPDESRNKKVQARRLGALTPGDARNLLEQLLDVYMSGLEAPCPFHPELSLRFVEELLKDRGPCGQSAWSKAVRKYENCTTKGQRAYMELCFGPVSSDDACLERFRAPAETIGRPLMEQIVERS